MLNPANSSIKATEYGLLMFDVPISRPYLYMKIRKVVHRSCLPVNLSVYLFDWGLKNSLDAEFSAMNAYTEASVHMVKFDTSERQQLEDLASKQLDAIFSKINFKLQEALKKAQSREDKTKALDKTEQKLQGYERLLTLYEFAKKVQPSLDILKHIVAQEYINLKGGTNATPGGAV